ncbi:MAG TPA: leucyl/phenylalanyl-tRNA--protein transferase [Phycisphaerales bacterium]|nr:leucyl/phenylalanyl-tRNA--protein transferase [Phycisphaerales bacterium]
MSKKMTDIRANSLDPQHPDGVLLRWIYERGIFPMADAHAGRIEYYSPDPRGIIPLQPLNAFHVPRNLAREVKRGRFDIRCDTAFEAVMRECAKARSEDNGTWMSEALLEGYLELFHTGNAHSVEAWIGSSLVGGLYGVHIGAAFFGESMFSRPEQGGTNASKVCLVHLVRWLQRQDFTLLDTQFWNPHLAQFGCIEIPRAAYLARLEAAIRRPREWGVFQPLCA